MGVLFKNEFFTVENHVDIWIYDTSSNDTLSTEPFRLKGFLSKCHFVECPRRRNRVSSNTFDEIFYAHLAAISYLLILLLYHVIVRRR